MEKLEKIEKIMKRLALVIGIVTILLYMFDFFSQEDYEHYDYELAKINKYVIGGEDHTELMSPELVDGFISSDYKKSSIDLGTKTIIQKTADSEAKYFYTMDGDEIVIKNKSFYHVDGVKLLDGAVLPDGVELNDFKQAFYKRDSRIEYAFSISMIVEDTLISMDVSIFFKK